MFMPLAPDVCADMCKHYKDGICLKTDGCAFLGEFGLDEQPPRDEIFARDELAGLSAPDFLDDC